MKKFFLILLAGVVLIWPVYIFSAQTASPSPEKAKEQAISPEDAQRIRDEVKKIGEIFGVKAEDKTEQKPEQKPEEKRKLTMADIADKALDLVTKSVATISAAIEKVAPEIWRIMIKQQYAKAATGPLIPFGLLILVYFYRRTLLRWWKEPQRKIKDEKGKDVDNDAWYAYGGFAKVVPLVFFCGFGIWFVVELGSAIRILINPEYYAIRDLLQMILRSGI